ncbi:NfeD family protein [Coprobacter tertius]|uniref:NfeD-like C-terminal domain-containing protein n=1 Tax=Coprobacter tertius TaxID=2944915 RepID=A0ABT1MHL6_9BACT|nr:NfeD family protein [Coprobacter tertius]MCP9611153.1 hypothetical protein [Coprobacter tertius]
MDIFIITLLILTAIFLVVLEVFFLPGITIAGIGSLLFFGGAIYYAFSNMGETAGYVTIIVSIVGCITGLIWFMRSKSLDRMALKTDIDSKVPTEIDDTVHVGDEGIALSRLNPMGTVLIGEKRIEGKTRDEFIDEGTPIIVERVEHTNVIVRKKIKE